MLSRLCLLLLCATGLSGCGTASHLLGQATGMVQSLTAPVLAPLGALRMADELPDSPRFRKQPEPAAPHDAAVSPGQR